MPELTYLPNVVTLALDRDKCSGCTMCTVVCPHDVFTMRDKKADIVNLDSCMECGACARNCPDDAIFVRPGVGCAYGIIMGKLKGTEPSCDCSDGCC